MAGLLMAVVGGGAAEAIDFTGFVRGALSDWLLGSGLISIDFMGALSPLAVLSGALNRSNLRLPWRAVGD
jgi:hypothetical protein